jgi:hypothetical protein
MVKPFRTKFVFIIFLISAMIIVTALTLSFTTITITTTTKDVYGQTGSMATLQNIGSTYAISIVPGAAHKAILFIIILL